VTISRKAAVSLLISLVFFAAFTAVAFSGLFSLVEIRFYRPSAVKSLGGEAGRDAEIAGEFLGEMRDRFAATLENGAVRRSFLPSQGEEDIFERSRLYGLLQESLGGLQWVRFVDSGGSRLHFSTLSQDILRRDDRSLAYRSYREAAGAVGFDLVRVPEGGEPRLTVDGGRLIFSFPFYDSLEVYRGTAVFSLSGQALRERLFLRGRLEAGEDIALTDDPRGVLVAPPYAGRDALVSQAAKLWREGILSQGTLDAAGGGALVLFSARTVQGLYTGRFAEEALFSVSPAMKIILLASFFITMYLAVFLLFNLRQDSLTVLQSRLKKLRVSLTEQYHDRYGDAGWSRWSREIEQRRGLICAELKRGLRFKEGGLETEQADRLIDRFWEDMAVLTGSRRAGPGREQPPVSPPGLPEAAPSGGAVEEPEVLEELDNGEGAEEPEVLEELDGGEGAEEAEVLEELDDGEGAEEPEVLEELDDGEAAEEPEVLEELDDGEGAEEPEVLEELDDGEAAEGEAAVSGDTASRIEFSSLPEREDGADSPRLAEGIEVVSPFAAMRLQLSGTNLTEEAISMDEKNFAPVTSWPPREGGLLKKTENLRRQLDGEEDSIFEERDGVHYIKEAVLRGETAFSRKLDPEFADLINSVIG
jgi:hypothetical protein